MRLTIICILLFQTLLATAQQIIVKDKSTGKTLTTVRLNNPEHEENITFSYPGYKPVILKQVQLKKLDNIVLLEDDNITLDAVVISALRWQQPQKEAPKKIKSIQHQDVIFQNPQTAADLLNQSGEVYIQKSQMSGGSPMIRGFSTNRVLITVDGVRMNNAIFRSGNLQNVISIDALAIENVEVSFGPGSLMYGSDAIGGVMSFRTLLPKFSVTKEPLVNGNLITRWSSANAEKTAHADVSIGLEKWAFVSNFSYSDFGDLKMGSNGPAEYLRPEYAAVINGTDTKITNPNPEKQVPTAYRQINLMQKIVFKPNDHWNFNYGVHFSASSDNPRYDNLLRYRGENLRSAEWYYGPQKWLMNNLDINYTAPNILFDEMKIQVAHQFFEESRHDRNFGNTNRTNNIEKVNAVSANLDFKKSLSALHEIYYGAEVVYNKVHSLGSTEDIRTGVFSDGPTRYPHKSDWSSYAAFITYLFRASDKLNIQTGLRYNQFLLNAKFNDEFYPFPFNSAKINQGAFTGSAGLVYIPAKSWQISSNFSTGFRAPNIDDIGKVFESTPGSVVVPNPDLQAEYAYNVDFGIAKTFGSIVKVDATSFYTYLDNAMVRRNYTLNGSSTVLYDGEISQVQAIQNAASAYVYGVQAGIEVNLSKLVAFNSQISYQHGEEELESGEKAPLRHAAPWFGSSHVTFSKSKFKADVYAFYNGEVSYDQLAPSEREKTYMYAIDAENNPYSPTWLTLNFKAMYQLSKQVMVNMGLENILNKRYRQYASGIVAPGRNLIVSLRASL